MLRTIRLQRQARWLALALGLVLALYWMVTVAVTPAKAASSFNVNQYDQCETGNPAISGGKCADWTNGILNGTHNVYHEDDVTPQRLVASFDATGPHTIDISYLTLDAGVHAYDSLATWNHTRTGADRCQGLGTGVTCVAGTPSAYPIPLDSTAGTHQITGQALSLYGGTITNAVYMGVGYYAPDYQTLRVTVSSTANRQIMLLFGGHIAASFGPRGWGAGQGAREFPVARTTSGSPPWTARLRGTVTTS